MAESADRRVLLVCPLGLDAELIKKVLEESSVQSEPYKDVASACEAVRFKNVGALMIAEEALGKEAIAVLAAALAEQPSWSDHIRNSLTVIEMAEGYVAEADRRLDMVKKASTRIRSCIEKISRAEDVEISEQSPHEP